MMPEAIKNFPQQFLYNPTIINAKKWKKFPRYFLIGMGGSHLAGDMIASMFPSINLSVRRDYGLPMFSDKTLKQSLIICSSYSGNTEEVIEAYHEARKKKLPTVSLAIGGELIALAKKYNTPYVQIPDTGIQPRAALGFSLRALLKVLNEPELFGYFGELAEILKPLKIKSAGKNLAKKMQGCVPVIYCSQFNEPIGWNWKIKLNETGKIPAYYNVIPEMNHNEMTGFDVKDTTKALSEKFYFLILKDPNDHPRIIKRMDILAKLYKNRGLKIQTINLQGKNTYERIFNSLLLADWTALHTAELYGLESEQVPMVEEFKKLIK